jgi:hypothetical protein
LAAPPSQFAATWETLRRLRLRAQSQGSSPQIKALRAAIGRLIDILTPAECANMFATAGYDPE